MKIRNPIITWAMAKTACWILRAIFLTTRVRHVKVVDDATPLEPPKTSTRYSFCVWHDGVLLALFSRKTYKLAAMVSRHQDGGYLSHALDFLGITPIRGSASRGGAQATRQLLDCPDMHICLTPDGPRGPRRKMKDGIVYIASRTGRPIVPTAMTASRFWAVPGGWSDMLVPKPFSQVLLLAGRPIEVPPDLSREEIAQFTARVQEEMDRLELLCERLITGEEAAAGEVWTPPVGDTKSDATESRAA